MDWKEISASDWERICPARIWERGRDYYFQGALLAACKLEAMLAGELIGSGMIYQARLWREAGELRWECDCPYPEFCKHLAALAFAWQQQPELFEDLAPRFEGVLNQVDDGVEIFKQLILKNPFDFIRTIQGSSRGNDFLYRRGLVNVVRNLFQRPLVNLSEVENLWERVQGVGQLLRTQLNAREKQALEPLGVLWENLVKTYSKTSSDLLKQLLIEMLELIKGIVHWVEADMLEVFWNRLYQQYMTPGLWEIGPELRQALREFCLIQPQLLEQISSENSDWSYLQWAANYELGMALPETPKTRVFRQWVSEKLNASVTGRLWLIDRLLNDDFDTALRLAKQGMIISKGVDKQAFRERMIAIHQMRREFKQGAALAFLQFQEAPSFDEYLRLKELLKDSPQIFDGYYLQIGSMLLERRAYPLLVRIMAAQEDLERLNPTLERLLDHPQLLADVLDGVSAAMVPAMLDAPVYQEIALVLLADGRRTMIKAARRWIIGYKKSCLKFERLERWQELLTRIEAAFGMNMTIRRQIGPAIAERIM